MAVVGGGCTATAAPLVLREVILLCPGDGWEGGRRAVVLQVEGAEGNMLRGALLITVVAWAQLLRLDLGPTLGICAAASQGGQGVLLLSLLVLTGFSHPGCHPSWADWAAAADAVGATVADRGGVRGARVPVGREVLIELINVKRLNVGDDVTAQLTNVDVAEVNVELTTAWAFGQRAEAAFTF